MQGRNSQPNDRHNLTKGKIFKTAKNMSIFNHWQNYFWHLLIHWSLVLLLCLVILIIEIWVTTISWRSSPRMKPLAWFSFLHHSIVLLLPFQDENHSTHSKCNQGYCHDWDTARHILWVVLLFRICSFHDIFHFWWQSREL